MEEWAECSKKCRDPPLKRPTWMKCGDVTIPRIRLTSSVTSARSCQCGVHLVARVDLLSWHTMRPIIPIRGIPKATYMLGIPRYFSVQATRNPGSGLSANTPLAFRPAALHPIIKRAFHPSRRRQDVFFFALPALKTGLLNVTRFSLLFLPFIFRYK